ncbi:MAG: carboxypeptidase-like regulatory domain-containing protein, partial [Bacteroidaceae bacterium]|nr:carboxypeptidase-like regulatory domain-containing protein [Bacteroidaceae bacterium]
MIRKRLPFLITTLILLTAGAKIQAQAVISGLVTDEYQQPIELVTVRQEGTVIGTTSSLQGKYSTHVSTQDSVVLIFSRIGFQTRRRILARPVGEIT